MAPMPTERLKTIGLFVCIAAAPASVSFNAEPAAAIVAYLSGLTAGTLLSVKTKEQKEQEAKTRAWEAENELFMKSSMYTFVLCEHMSPTLPLNGGGGGDMCLHRCDKTHLRGDWSV